MHVSEPLQTYLLPPKSKAYQPTYLPQSLTSIRNR